MSDLVLNISRLIAKKTAAQKITMDISLLAWKTGNSRLGNIGASGNDRVLGRDYLGSKDIHSYGGVCRQRMRFRVVRDTQGRAYRRRKIHYVVKVIDKMLWMKRESI